jgi:[ribosomal protein S5]-alanine N-acetyltransferase
MKDIIFKSIRLYVRYFKPSDLETIYKYRNDIRCSKYQTWADTSLEELKAFIYELRNKKIGKDWIQLAIIRSEDDLHLGDIYLNFDESSISIGYTIDADFHRQGYGYEILVELLKYLKANFKQKSILAKVFIPNIASINLLVKLGFKKIGIIKSESTIVFEYKHKKSK